MTRATPPPTNAWASLDVTAIHRGARVPVAGLEFGLPYRPVAFIDGTWVAVERSQLTDWKWTTPGPDGITDVDTGTLL